MTKSAKCLLYKHEDPQRKDRLPQWFSPYNPRATETDSWIGQPVQPLWELQANERSPSPKTVIDSPWRTTQEVDIRPLCIHTYTNIHTRTRMHTCMHVNLMFAFTHVSTHIHSQIWKLSCYFICYYLEGVPEVVLFCHWGPGLTGH